MPSIIRATTTSGLQVAPDNSGSLQLQTNGTTTAVTIDTSQNVGIGTTSPSYRLDLFGTNCSLQIRDIGQTNGLLLKQNNSDGGNLIYATNNNYLALGTNNTERMRIDSSGRPLFNTTSALNAGYMSLLFDGSAYNGFTLKTSYATLGSVYLYFINSAGNVAGYVTQNGTTTVNYVTSSDYRMKENVVPITNALDRVAKLKPVTYIWKDTNNEQGEGFIAHELQEVCPLAVSGEKDAVNEDGTIKPQGIDTSKLVATLTAAIQEQQTIINDLKARVTALEAK